MLNASKIRISVSLAPNCMRPILLDSLWVDLQFKNVACQYGDTFIYSFI
jgi:hypothetical protein